MGVIIIASFIIFFHIFQALVRVAQKLSVLTPFLLLPRLLILRLKTALATSRNKIRDCMSLSQRLEVLFLVLVLRLCSCTGF